jgi:hypothetical protein
MIMNAPHRFSPNALVEQAVEYALRLGLDARWETNGKGQILVNPPVGLLHAKRFDRIAQAIRRALPDWQVWMEVGLHTGDGVKAPELLAASPAYAENVDARGFLLSAPELCVEVMSPSNRWEEMRHKALLYLAAGAQEAWVCDEAGELHFFGGAGEQDESALVPGMARRID